MNRKSVFQDILGAVVKQDVESQDSVQMLSLDVLRLPERQPRRYFDPRAMDELVRSIQRHGILQPLLIRPLREDPSGEYEIVAGERRYRAAREVGLAEIPVVIRRMGEDEAMQYALLENLQREDLNPVEETEGILSLLALGLEISVEDVISLLYRMQNSLRHHAQREGVSATHNVMGNSEEEVVLGIFDGLGIMAWESFVNNRLPLLNLPEDILQALRSGRIAYTKARTLARLTDKQEREALLQEAIAKDLSLSIIRSRVKARLANNTAPTPLDLPSRASALARKLRRRKVLRDDKKRERLETLLAEMERLLEI
ncbi:MAG: ParB/RepB/Spo0J family partition protein [Rubrobacter sp.]|nr:ParB/RepB/Spo0J family partition protein [Rubrobacter sp.]